MLTAAVRPLISPTLSSAHVALDFCIDHSVFVSAGGQKSTLYSCPTPAQYHERLWDDKWGRGGKLVGVREVSTANLDGKLPRPIDTEYIKPGFRVPNAMFARKHHTEDESKPLPDKVQNGATCPTADERVFQRFKELRNDALVAVSKLPGVENLKAYDRQCQESRAIRAYMQSYEPPATPGLFFDSNLDFKWENGTSPLTTAEQPDRFDVNEELVNAASTQQHSVFGETVDVLADKECFILEQIGEASSLRLTSRSKCAWAVVAEDAAGNANYSSTQERDPISDDGNDVTDNFVIKDDPANNFLSSQERTQKRLSQRIKLMTFDGRADNVNFLPQPNHINNTIIPERNSAAPRFDLPMDINQSQTRLPATSLSSARVKPLHVRKNSSQVHLERDQQSSNNHDFRGGSSGKPVYPPRTSSICSHEKYRDPATLQPLATRANTLVAPLNSEEYSIATSGQGHYTSYYSTDAHSADITTGRSTVFEHQVTISLRHIICDHGRFRTY